MERLGLGRAGVSRDYNHVPAIVTSNLRRKVGGDEVAVASRLPVSLSTIIIDRIPKVCLRAIKPKAKRKAIRSAAAVPFTVDPNFVRVGVVDSLIEEAKHRPRARRSRAKDAPRRRKRKTTPATASARTAGLAELQKLAERIENAYQKPTTARESDYERVFRELESQIRTGRYASGGEAVSCSSPTLSSVRKRKGRAPNIAVDELVDHQADVISSQIPKDGFLLHSKPSVVVKRRAGEGKYRLNLISRIALRKRRQDRSLQVQAACTNIASAAQDIWSPEAEKLINQYGTALDLGMVDWDNLKRGLLSAEEESELAILMKPMKNLEKIRKALREDLQREPSDEEWSSAAQIDIHTLRRHLLLGKSARNSLIQHNLRLVLSQAHKYYKESSSLSLFDLCQEGVLGLIRGVDKFDPKRGHRFSTYAVYWVRNSILRAQTRNGNSLRSPFNVAMHKLNIRKATEDLMVELERTPTNDEVMNRLGIAPERFADIMRSSARIASMNKPSLITGEEMVDSVPDMSDSERVGLTSHSFRDDASVRFGVEDVLDSLRPTEGLVLRQRFGLDGNGQRTLGEIGESLGISREMVRKSETRALLKLRQPTRKDYLRTYLSSSNA